MQRHNRSQQFDDALARTDREVSAGGRWSDDAPDPNSPRVLAPRAVALRAAWRPPISDRAGFLVSRCSGKRVLDIGCVAHDVARMERQDWLHGRIAAVAGSCVGVDVIDTGVEAMRRAGYTAVVHDITHGAGGLEDHLPADVIVAGEVFEHMDSTHALFRFAEEALAPGGELIITTPNPYAPERVWAGQRGHVWENVDHVTHAFPSGIAELAERHRLRLTEAFTVGQQRRPERSQWASLAKRRLLGSGWVTTGITTIGPLRQVRVRRSPSSFRRSIMPARNRWFLGETFVYVVTNPGRSSGND